MLPEGVKMSDADNVVLLIGWVGILLLFVCVIIFVMWFCSFLDSLARMFIRMWRGDVGFIYPMVHIIRRW